MLSIATLQKEYDSVTDMLLFTKLSSFNTFYIMHATDRVHDGVYMT